MNRTLLAAAAPKWIAIEALSAQTKLRMLAMFVEAIMDAIELDGREPDTWEAMYLVYAIHALVGGMYYGALTFAELALTEPEAHRPPCLLPSGPRPVTLADLREAIELVRTKLEKW